jgi:hypothetical protein
MKGTRDMSETTYRQTDINALRDAADYVRVLVGETLAVTTSVRGEIRIKGCGAKIICTLTSDDTGTVREGFCMVPIGVHHTNDTPRHYPDLPEAVAAVLVHKESDRLRKGSDAVVAHWRMVADALAARKTGLTA